MKRFATSLVLLIFSLALYGQPFGVTHKEALFSVSKTIYIEGATSQQIRERAIIWHKDLFGGYPEYNGGDNLDSRHFDDNFHWKGLLNIDHTGSMTYHMLLDIRDGACSISITDVLPPVLPDYLLQSEYEDMYYFANKKNREIVLDTANRAMKRVNELLDFYAESLEEYLNRDYNPFRWQTMYVSGD